MAYLPDNSAAQQPTTNTEQPTPHQVPLSSSPADSINENFEPETESQVNSEVNAAASPPGLAEVQPRPPQGNGEQIRVILCTLNATHALNVLRCRQEFQDSVKSEWIDPIGYGERRYEEAVGDFFECP